MVVVVLGDIINVDLSCEVDDQIQGQVEGVVDGPPISHPLLVGSVEDDVLDHHSFLVVNKAQIKGILSGMVQNSHRMGKAIPNCHSLQPCDLFLASCFLQLQLSCNGWSIFSCITLSKNEERLISCNTQLVEAPI